MSRLELASPTRADIIMEELYKDLERRIESSPPGLCPVDMARAFLELCHAQTCGKCVPCRIGLGQLNGFIKDVLDGNATMETLDIMEETALSIMESADCAIGYEAAHTVYKGLIGYRDDYVEHIKNGRCTCTYSQPVPCVSLCPAHVDIPGYVALVREGRYADAIRLIRKDNPFPTTCGFICETTVYEMLPKLGGMLRYGIPNYRLPKDRLEEDVNAILKTGVDVKYGLKIGKDITIQQLQEEYDAVLITIGASTDKKLGLEGEGAEGIFSAVQFLRNVGKNIIMDLTGKEVAVIGGGNVTMDAVRTAKRLGAKKVSVVYRRRVADMTALPSEIEGAIAEGVEVQTLKAPASLDVDENNQIKGIYVTPQMISSIKDGRASIKPTGEEDIYIPCDVLVVAIGQNIETKHFEDAGIPVNRGKIVTKSNGSIEGMPGVFAGGDCASGPASVIKAIAGAKVAAANIDEYLGYHHEISCDVEIPEANLDDRTPCGRVNLTEREANERVNDWDACENCMTEKEAKQEAGRCLRCDHFGYGIFKGGREKLW